MTRRIGAAVLIKRGEVRGALLAKQEMLLRLIRNRFQKVPRAVQKTIQATNDKELLVSWFDAVWTAPTLQDIGILPSVHETRGSNRSNELNGSSVRIDERQKVENCLKSELTRWLIEEAKKLDALRPKQSFLLLQMRRRFKKVSRAVEKAVWATYDIERIHIWLDRVSTAPTLQDMGIVPASKKH